MLETEIDCSFTSPFCDVYILLFVRIARIEYQMLGQNDENRVAQSLQIAAFLLNIARASLAIVVAERKNTKILRRVILLHRPISSAILIADRA